MTRTYYFLLFTLLPLGSCSEGAGPPPPPSELPAPDFGEVRIEISGAVAHDGTWQSYGIFRDLLAADTGDLSALSAYSPGAAVPRDLEFFFPGRLDVGAVAIGRYVFGTVPAQPAAFVKLGTEFFASIPGGTLTVTAAAYPPKPGLVVGRLDGTMTFKAVRLKAEPGAAPVETTDTIAVRARFAAHWSHFLVPNVTVTLNGGGPVLGSSLLSFGQSVSDDHGGRYVYWDSDFDRVNESYPFEISQEFRLLAPAVGNYTLGDLTPATYADPAQWPTAFSALYYRDDPRIALSAGGTLTITSFLAPTEYYFGEIHGTLDAPLALWADETTVTADTVHVFARFAVQLCPASPCSSGPWAASRGWRASTQLH